MNEIASRAGSRLRWGLGAAATVLLVGGLWFLGTRVDSGADVRPEAIEGPKANLDHWHAVYAVWDCTANDEEGAWVEPFSSDRDDWGIHSHQDGLIHIHPFSAQSEGQNAQFALFVETMGVALTDESVTLEDGTVLAEGELCAGEPAVLHLRKWAFDFQLLNDPERAPLVIAEDIGGQRFLNDREVWVLAFAPIDADLPLPPEERFATLNQHTAVLDPASLPVDIAPGDRVDGGVLPDGWSPGDPLPMDESRDSSLWDDAAAAN